MCPKYSIGEIGLINGPICLILGQIQAHIPIAFYQVYYQKNDIGINKFCIVYFSLENSIFLYCQNNMNHLSNSAGLCQEWQI